MRVADVRALRERRESPAGCAPSGHVGSVTSYAGCAGSKNAIGAAKHAVKVASGGAFISAEVAQQLALGAMPGAQGPLHSALSDREFQVF